MQTVQGPTMYRRTRKAAEFRARRVEAMRRGREAARMSRPMPERMPDRPDLRIEIIVRRHDCGELIEHTFAFHDLPRVDTYRVTCDGNPWQDGIGMSRALALIRKAMPRLPGERTYG
jgi:hypothetical protein